MIRTAWLNPDRGRSGDGSGRDVAWAPQAPAQKQAIDAAASAETMRFMGFTHA